MNARALSGAIPAWERNETNNMKKVVFSVFVIDENGAIEDTQGEIGANAFAVNINRSNMTYDQLWRMVMCAKIGVDKMFKDPNLVGVFVSEGGNFDVEWASLLTEGDRVVYKAWLHDLYSEECYNAIHNINGSSLEDLLGSKVQEKL